MSRMLPIVIVVLWSAHAAAAEPSCAAQAKDKKLAGAAQSSFMKKCTTDATNRCDATANEKKLAGAARNSYTKKCVADSVG